MESWPVDKLRAMVQERLSDGIPPAQVASQLAVASGWPRRRIYRMITELEG
jgi:hypothetical protein